MKAAIGRLCVITDTVIQRKYSHYECAEMAIDGGADMIQFREKVMSTGEMINTAIHICELCNSSRATFIVNDRVDIAMISGADGVHLGIEDISIADARRLLGNSKIIGGTAHSLAEAFEAEKNGADYIGYGHIYPTGSKIRETKPKGTGKLAELCAKIKIPVIAIGGIGPENAGEVMKSGAYGVAVIGSVLNDKDPREAVKKLRKVIYA